MLTRLGVVQYFDDMVFGTEIERGKPWPDIFLKVAEKAHAAPADCLVLEDSEAGIQPPTPRASTSSACPI